MVHGFIAGYLIVRYARFLAWLMAWCLAGFLVALPSGLGWVALAGFGVFGWKCRQARLARVYRHAPRPRGRRTACRVRTDAAASRTQRRRTGPTGLPPRGASSKRRLPLRRRGITRPAPHRPSSFLVAGGRAARCRRR